MQPATEMRAEVPIARERLAVGEAPSPSGAATRIKIRRKTAAGSAAPTRAAATAVGALQVSSSDPPPARMTDQF